MPRCNACLGSPEARPLAGRHFTAVVGSMQAAALQAWAVAEQGADKRRQQRTGEEKQKAGSDGEHWCQGKRKGKGEKEGTGAGTLEDG